MKPSPQFELEALARQIRRSALAFGWLDVGVQQEQDILASIADAQNSLLSAFFRQQALRTDLASSLHKPLDLIPASLHPTDQ